MGLVRYIMEEVTRGSNYPLYRKRVRLLSLHQGRESGVDFLSIESEISRG